MDETRSLDISYFEDNSEKIPESGCWIWSKAISSTGYGNFRHPITKQVKLAHRASWEALNGTIPSGMCILHSCDIRCCVNPSHMRLGSHQDNAYDMVLKDRQAKGKDHGLAKLTDVVVEDIRLRLSQGQSQSSIAKKYDVHQSLVSLIKLGKIWRHV
jgi:hypothetical protein